MNITYENEVLNFHHGQTDCEAGIYVNGEIAGLVKYVLYNKELTISHIFVRPEFRRKGYGSRLMKYIKEINPEYTYKSSLKTDDGAVFKHKELPLDESRINEEYKKGSVWRTTSQKWLIDFINKHGVIDHGKHFISFSFDSESGDQDKFGGGEIVIEFDENKLLRQGEKQNLGAVEYDEFWMEEHPDVCAYVTGYRTKQDYFETLDENNPGDWD